MKKVFIIAVLLFTFLILSGCSRTFKVTFNIYSGVSESQIIKKGDTINDFTPTLEGHKFISWLYNDEVFDVNTPIENNITLQAYWEKLEYEVKFLSDGELYLNSKIAYGDILKEVEAPTKDEYLFLAWLYNNKEVEFPLIVTDNMEINAKWVKDSEYKPKLKISFNSTGAKIEYDDIILNRLDEAPTLPTPTYDGHQFLGWFIDGSDKEIKSGDVIKEIEDFTLVAKWKKID